MNPQETFIDLLLASMLDAATGGHLTQLQTTITPEGKKSKTVRIIIVPEEMQWKAPKNQPFGTDYTQQ